MSEQAEEQTNDTSGEFQGLPSSAPAPEQNDAGETDSQDNGAQQPEVSSRPANYQGYVDLSPLPEELRTPLERRFAQMSREMKADKNQLKKFMDLAAQQSEAIENLTNGFGQVTTQLEERAFSEAESQLVAESDAAFESGNMKAYREAEKKLGDLRVKRGIEAALAEREQPKQKQEKQPVQPNYEDSGLYFSEDDMPVLDRWQTETDDSGQLLRPWAKNSSADPRRPDPKFKRGLFETTDVLSDPRYAHMTIEQKLAEVDKRMGVQKQGQQGQRQNVMGGGLTGNRKIGKLTLTPEQQNAAVRMRAGGSKAKSNEDHYKAYLGQLQKIQQSKGAR